MPGGPSQANDAVGRFNRQARDWYGQMQQVAAQFAGQDSSASDVSQAWRSAIGATADNPFLDLFKGMRGPGAHGLDEWLEQVQPYLDGLQQQSQRWQQLPAFGQYREHQERWQALQLAQQEYQHQTTEYNKLVAHCLQEALEVFEDKLVGHEEPGRQITSARALFDLWIDSAEQAYARIALSQEFRETYGALTNAQMRLRAGIQREVEHMTGLFGMPTRTEVDSAHRKIAELERALRRAVAGSKVARPSKPTAPPVHAVAETVQDKPAKAAKPGKTLHRRAPKPAKPVAKAVVRKPASKKVAAKKVAARKSASSRLASKGGAMVAKPVARKSTTKVVVRKPAPVAKEKTAVAKTKTVKQATKKAVNKPVQKQAAVSSTQSGSVVSMKDWVARYAAANADEASGKQKGSGKKRARK